MGATVTTGKAVMALPFNGQTYWLLYERTYEKNVYPHSPRWSPTKLGTLTTVLPYIGASAAHAAGGMLQSSSGRLTPENYWKGWMRQFANPIAPLGHEVARISGTGLRYGIATAAKVADMVEAIGLPEQASTLRAGKDVELALATHVAHIAQLTQRLEVGPWHFVGTPGCLSNASSEVTDASRLDRTLGWPGTKSSSNRPAAPLRHQRFIRLTLAPSNSIVSDYVDGALFGLREDGKWAYLRSDYAALQIAIEDAARVEHERPGSVLKAIEATQQLLGQCVKRSAENALLELPSRGLAQERVGDPYWAYWVDQLNALHGAADAQTGLISAAKALTLNIPLSPFQELLFLSNAANLGIEATKAPAPSLFA